MQDFLLLVYYSSFDMPDNTWEDFEEAGPVVVDDAWFSSIGSFKKGVISI